MIKISDQIAYCSRFNDRVDDVHSESNDADAILNPANLKGIYLWILVATEQLITT